MKWAEANTSILAAYVIAFAIFVIDFLTPADNGVWVFYLIPVVLTQQAPHYKATFTLARVCTALMIVDLLANSPGDLPLHDFIDRAIGIGLVWTTASVLVHRKRRAEVLRDPLEMYRQIASSSLLSILIYDAESGRCVLANETAAHSIGTSVDGLLAQDFRRISSWKASGLLEAAESVLATGTDNRMSCQLHTSFGNDIWIDCLLARFQSMHKHHLLLMFEDITERKHAEESLRENEQLLRESQKVAALGYYSFNVLTGKWTSSELLDEVFGIDQNHARTVEGWLQIVHPDHRAGMQEYLLQHVLKEGNGFDREYRIVRVVDGEERWVHGRGKLAFDGEGNPVKMIGTIQDITERKVAAGALTRSEERYKELFESAPVGYHELDVEGRVTNVNQTELEMLGYAREEMMGRPIWEFVGDKEAARIRVLAKLAGKMLHDTNAERAFARKDGTSLSVLSDERLLKNERGTVVGMRTVMQDITERKRAEERLRNSEEQFRLISENAEDLIAVLDLEGRRVYNSPSYKPLLGDPNRFFGTDSFQEVHPDDRERVRGVFTEIVKSGIGQRTEYRFVSSDGSVRHIESQGSVIRDADGRVKNVVVVGRDITVRKQVEEELRQAEEKYRSIFNSVPVGLYQSTLEGVYLTANDKMAEILGFESPEELIASTSDLRNEFYVRSGRRAEFVRRVREEGAVYGFESQAYRKNRDIIWVSEDARALYDKHGTITGFEGTTTDITSRKRAGESVQRLLRAVEQTNDIIFMTDAAGRINYINPAFTTAYGYTEQESYEKTPRILKSGVQDESFYGMLWDTILSGQNIRVELINKTKSGEIVTVESTVSPVFDSDVGLSGFIAVQRDVTSERKHEEERKVLERELFQAQKLESIGTLAGGIAHDFNNLLAIILGYSTLLQKHPGDVERALKSSERISNAVQRGADLVRQILMFARKNEVVFAPLDLNQLVTEVQRMMQETFPRTITVEVSLESPIPAIEADRTQVYQTLLNLCVNARDAMPDGGTITIATAQVGGEELRHRLPDAEGEEFVNISVRDTGTGMDEATQQRIFEPFFTTKEQGKGTGLGLAVVYGIVKSHRGYLDVQSTLGQGTTFNLYFPIHLKPRVEGKPPVEEQKSVVGGTETVLVIEDETLLRDLLRASLEAKGYTVLTASDGADAVRLYKKHHDEIALVISDLGLPQMDGARVFSELRMINPGAKVLISSGYVDPGVKAGLLKAGAKGFLQKPFAPVEILRRVREALDQE